MHRHCAALGGRFQRAAVSGGGGGVFAGNSGTLLVGWHFDYPTAALTQASTSPVEGAKPYTPSEPPLALATGSGETVNPRVPALHRFPSKSRVPTLHRFTTRSRVPTLHRFSTKCRVPTLHRFSTKCCNLPMDSVVLSCHVNESCL